MMPFSPLFLMHHKFSPDKSHHYSWTLFNDEHLIKYFESYSCIYVCVCVCGCACVRMRWSSHYVLKYECGPGHRIKNMTWFGKTPTQSDHCIDVLLEGDVRLVHFFPERQTFFPLARRLIKTDLKATAAFAGAGELTPHVPGRVAPTLFTPRQAPPRPYLIYLRRESNVSPR